MGHMPFLWGKSGAEGRPHHLVLHMVDSGMVAQALLQAPQWRRTRRLLVDLGELDEPQLENAIGFLVALHDIGKAAPGFQRLVPSLWELVRAQGLVDGHELWRGVRFRHDVESYATLGESVLPEWLDPRVADATPIRLRRALSGIAQALGGHHGAFVSAGEVRESGYPQISSDSRLEADDSWIGARVLLVETLAEVFGIDSRIRVGSGHLSSFCSILNGLTILSDWVASNEEYFPCAGDTQVSAYVAGSKDRARVAVETTGLLRFPDEHPVGVSFSTLFPGKDARPVQAAIDDMELDLKRGPLLTVIEAPTGEGKTEAALLLSQRLTAERGGGMYFALPTLATSEQLFQRVVDFFAGARLGGTAGMTLVHGQADLSLHVDRLTRRDAAAASELTDPVVIDSWLLPRKRALLAPYSVGTVDQAMMAALRVRHGTLRLLGLAGKVVIIDEIHAYDAYMSEIIARLLEWLAELEVSVILLSATLPAATRRGLTAAFGVTETEDPEPVAYPLITSGQPGGAPRYVEPSASDPCRSVAVEWISADSVSLAAGQAVEAAAAGAAVGWVCDTVASSQQTYIDIKSLVDGLAADTRPTLVLYHARMILGRRMQVERRVEELVGKTSTRERGCIIVATQVVEQSLDIDFDLLLTELAPVDLLLQRMGRLHRHQRTRVDCVKRPLCRVILPDRVGGDEPATAIEYVYEPFVLIKTLVTLRGRSTIRVPHDVRELVETVYDGQMPSVADLGAIGVSVEAATATRVRLRTNQGLARGAARLHLLASPDGGRFVADRHGVPLLDDSADEDVLERQPDIGAQTRLAAPSIRVVLIDENDDQLRDGAVLIRDQRLPDDLARWLFDRSVAVAHRGLLAHLMPDYAEHQPASFRRTPSLRSHALLRTTNGRYEWQDGGRTYRLSVDEELGVIIEGVDIG